MSAKKNLSIKETFNKAIEYHKIKKIYPAKKLYSEVIKKDPNHINALNNLGIIFFSLKKFDDAIKVFQKAITVNYNFASAHNNLGLVYIELQSFQKAINSFEEAIKMSPNYFEAQYNVGLVHYKSKEYQKAINSYEKAIKINPNNFRAHNNLGIIFYESGKYQKAINSYEKAIKINPNIMETYSNIGLVYEKTEETDKAINSYLKVPKSDSNYINAQYCYASLLYKIKEYKKAVKIFKSIDYKKSKTYLVKSLFELNDKSNFLIELDEEINKGKINAIIGSLITSTKIKYGIKKKNLFCEDPLNYVFNKNLKKLYDFDNIFIKTTKEILNPSVFKGRSQPLLINGIQSAGNIFNDKNINIKKIEQIIHKEIEKYRTNYIKSKEGFMMKWPKNYELTGWLVKMKNGGKINPHIHEHGWLSGSIYINVPSKLEEYNGNLVLSLNNQQNEILNNKNNKIIDVITGSICLFPASLFHYTIPFKSKEERIVLAFDVVPL